MEGERGDDGVMSRLVLRAPSKLNAAGGQKGLTVVQGLGEGEDSDTILHELFADLRDEPSRLDRIDRGVASYKLISPNLVTPTKKQTKRIAINYSNKWLGPAGTAKPKQRIQRGTPIHSAAPRDVTGEEGAAGFESTLGKAVKQRRSSRKKSRGDWDGELFG